MLSCDFPVPGREFCGISDREDASFLISPWPEFNRICGGTRGGDWEELLADDILQVRPLDRFKFPGVSQQVQGVVFEGFVEQLL